MNGKVLRVMQESAEVVQPGDALIEVGDPSSLEIVVDVLSQDAVRIAPGDPVLLEGWGGEQPLHATVRRVEPSAFTKVSALGVEEQRVNVIIDLDNSVSDRGTLGDQYRVDARIIVWQMDDALTVPTSAIFRHSNDWAVFVVDGGRAMLRTVRIRAPDCVCRAGTARAQA